jgi:hypothetical protein
VVVVLVRDDHGDGARRFRDRRRELARIDIELAAGVFDDERGMFELGESHGSSQHRASVGAQAPPPARIAA